MITNNNDDVTNNTLYLEDANSEGRFPEKVLAHLQWTEAARWASVAPKYF